MCAAVFLSAALLALSVFGVSYIFSTGYLGSAYPIRPNWLRQCVFLGIGAAAAWGMSRLDHRGAAWRAVVWGGYGASVMLLAVVLVAGREIGGARRWLPLGPLLLQILSLGEKALLAGAIAIAGIFVIEIRKRGIAAIPLVSVFR